MSAAVYGRPDENVAPLLTWSGITVDAAYAIAALTNLDPADPVLFTATSGTLTGTAGGPQRIDTLLIVNHNLKAGTATVTLSNNNGLTPVVGTLLTYANGHRAAVYFDLTGQSVGVRTATSWSLAFATNDANLAIGEILAYSAKRSLTRNIKWGLVAPEEHANVRVSSTLGVDIVYRPELWHRGVKGSIQTTDAGATDLLELSRAAQGGGIGFLFLLDPAVPTGAYMARFQSDAFTPRYDFLDNVEVSDFVLEEVPKGPRL